MAFSPLVFNGQSFLGGGVELTPGKFYLGAFYGRLNKAVSVDTTYDRHMEPRYARKGYGIKVGLNGEKAKVDMQYFYAEDDKTSVKRPADSLVDLSPQSNNVLALSWEFKFFKKLVFSADVAASLLNRDISYDNIERIGTTEIPSFVQKIAPIDYSSVLSWSGQTSLALNLDKF